MHLGCGETFIESVQSYLKAPELKIGKSKSIAYAQGILKNILEDQEDIYGFKNFFFEN